MKLSKVGVVGAGNIGTSVIADLLLHGLEAVAVDNSDLALHRAHTEVANAVRFAPLLSKDLPKVTATDAIAKMELTTDLEKLASCDFVIENVTEDWEIKRQLYLELDRVLPGKTCIGANTSCISISRLARVTQRPAKVIGIHLMNPVYLKSTVEVIRGEHTTDETVNKLTILLSQLGKQAILVEDVPGFVSNRISHLFMNEAALVLQEKVASADKIDTIFKQCFGHKMGPLETADLIGLDTVVRSLDVLYDSYRDPKYRCSSLLREMVAAGQLGRKSGQGFYTYQCSAKPPSLPLTYEYNTGPQR